MRKALACEHGRLECHKCRYKRRKLIEPKKLAYWSLKAHAKSRGHSFDLTFEQFDRFCIKTQYIQKRGITAESYHIDRKDETLGYTESNIRLLTNSENIKKYKVWAGTQENPRKLVTKKLRTNTHTEDDTDCPF